MNNDPFAPESDPDFHLFQTKPSQDKTTEGAPCHCNNQTQNLNRRQFLATASSLSLLPMAATAESFIPCIQDTQKIKRCHHRFCKNFGGGREYYDRL